MIEWAWHEFTSQMPTGQVFALAVALAIGLALTEAMAHMLPPDMPAWRADRLTRLVVLGVTMCTAFALQQTVIGGAFALLAGIAAPTLYQFTTRYIYSRWPVLEPKALKP